MRLLLLLLHVLLEIFRDEENSREFCQRIEFSERELFSLPSFSLSLWRTVKRHNLSQPAGTVMFVSILILESRDNEIHIPANGDAAADLLPSSHPARSSFVVKEARFSYDSKSGLMITTGRDIIARSGPP